MQELMIEKLKKEAGATIVDINDISYDAGFLYLIYWNNNVITVRLEMTVVSPKFREMKLLQQHRLLNKVFITFLVLF